MFVSGRIRVMFVSCRIQAVFMSRQEFVSGQLGSGRVPAVFVSGRIRMEVCLRMCPSSVCARSFLLWMYPVGFVSGRVWAVFVSGPCL